MSANFGLGRGLDAGDATLCIELREHAQPKGMDNEHN